MTDKKKHKHKEEINEANAETVATPEISEQVSADAERDALKRQLEEIETKLADSVEGWQRSVADF